MQQHLDKINESREKVVNHHTTDDRTILFAQLGSASWVPSKEEVEKFEQRIQEKVGDDYLVVARNSKTTLDVVAESWQEKPILFARLGESNYAVMNSKYDWVPNEDTIKECEDYLKSKVGDRYTVIVYHSGSNLSVID